MTANSVFAQLILICFSEMSWIFINCFVLALTLSCVQTQMPYDENVDGPTTLVTLPPCGQQFNYQINVMQCSEDPEHQGVWTIIDLDPAVCSGFCNYTGATSLFSSSPTPSTVEIQTPTLSAQNNDGPTTLLSCELQHAYIVKKLECEHQGVWTVVNSHPAYCLAYCDKTATPTPPLSPAPTAVCDIKKLKSDCLNTKNGICSFEVVDASTCNVGCACVSADPPFITCDEALAADKERCLKREDEKMKCAFVVSDPSSCQGDCQCRMSVRKDKRLKCKPVVV